MFLSCIRESRIDSNFFSSSNIRLKSYFLLGLHQTNPVIYSAVYFESLQGYDKAGVLLRIVRMCRYQRDNKHSTNWNAVQDQHIATKFSIKLFTRP